MLLESVTEEHEMRIGTVFKMVGAKLFRRMGELEFQKWWVTDFDNHLNGNPHV